MEGRQKKNEEETKKERSESIYESRSVSQLFATPWTVAHQTPKSMEFSRQEYCSGLPFPSSRESLRPRDEPRSPALQADSLPF